MKKKTQTFRQLAEKQLAPVLFYIASLNYKNLSFTVPGGGLGNAVMRNRDEFIEKDDYWRYTINS